ncbi:hydroxypyruvate isomerase family protein [Marinomonas mediterranea]|jgi:Hydroxypyruvate isomerase|uniref:Hydroxypyruvate isomerase n=1 Tax=Marinomonas mediterranea (strain ATCC 700492 / JCM 21426 / NBRC 103028 / MMB-1) TaxID=717774 RepID=F2JXL9_MARM1|nr:TIM barrel protein [Marinomonas mediterranea]ADZ93017.1 Hydroxypyruvate isomerase [Marinomonas mediterranea MMB-1]WCN10928.1 TIM barrel protein [Marinomonas mediterranea]WCN14990.1 TIM barrel protein [Marinomonas mediterranea]WCN19034.1 TIM barrel protein [Marinomonas mediterranea MMB-1]
MTTFSANLGFLWNDRPLPEAIKLAYQAGYSAVECHWPYQFDASEVKAALEETGLQMLGLNTDRGNLANGENGLSALPGREAEARAAIDQSIDYAIKIEALNIHVMAGFSTGEEAKKTFINNLLYASDKAKPHNINILIEPLNHYDAPNYFLQTSEQAKDILQEIGRDNVKLMFDCYHLQIMEGDICRRLTQLLPIIGHIQIASVPDRSEPNTGELNYGYVLSELDKLGYSAPIGAEYKSKAGKVDSSWLDDYR